MSTDFWLGLATIPTIAAAVLLVVKVRRFVRDRIQNLRGFNPRRTIPLAARLAVARRAIVWSTPRVAVAVVVGTDYDAHRRAEAALLDVFVPLTDDDIRQGRG
jgi:hypothetical protein